jgi:hypothetical protein
VTRAPGETLVLDVAGDLVEIRCSTVADGDFHIEGSRAALLHRRASFAPGAWTQLDEVHGTTVRRVDRPGEHDFEVGDALVTRRRGCVLAVWVGDCAPVAFVGDGGAIGIAHAGWKGAIDGILQATVAALQPDVVTAALGPCIHACCYEFGEGDLAVFTDRFGSEVAGITAWGTPALDMPAVVRAALAECGVELIDDSRCTGCDAALYYSHRRRQQAGRQVMTICKRAAR